MEEVEKLMMAFVADPLAVPLAAEVVLADYGQDTIYDGRVAARLILEAYFGEGLANSRVDPWLTMSKGQVFVVAGIFNGRHGANFLGIPTTNRQVTVPLCIICQVSIDCIHHIALYYDAGTLLRQLGLALSVNE